MAKVRIKNRHRKAYKNGDLSSIPPEVVAELQEAKPEPKPEPTMLDSLITAAKKSKEENG